MKVVDETPEPAADEDGGVETDTEQAGERSSENLCQAEPELETKTTMKSNGIPHSPLSTNGIGKSFEKLTDVTEPPTPPPLPGVT